MESNIANTPGFCPKCGAILPPLKATGGVMCYVCEENFKPSGNQSIRLDSRLPTNTLKIL